MTQPFAVTPHISSDFESRCELEEGRITMEQRSASMLLSNESVESNGGERRQRRTAEKELV